ncbi:hypothetical protein PoMZ_10694 [Pyricularia oryzae]|uniref:Uncharacterized protein n=1 Tax=Pyricularia oryzae TaxID=318829 RepID=A0A4P7MY93_PYROR|nr:hypothetical protein PoMZ_10694 [Pyricularia oryzae]
MHHHVLFNSRKVGKHQLRNSRPSYALGGLPGLAEPVCSSSASSPRLDFSGDKFRGLDQHDARLTRARARLPLGVLLEVLGIGSDSLSVVGAVSLALASIISRSSLFSCWISSLRKLAMLRSLSASPLARASMRSLCLALRTSSEVTPSSAISSSSFFLISASSASAFSRRLLDLSSILLSLISKPGLLLHLSYLCNFQAAVRVCHMDASVGIGMAA